MTIDKIIAKAIENVSKLRGLVLIEDSEFGISGEYLDQYLLCLHICQLIKEDKLMLILSPNITKEDTNYLNKLIKSIKENLK